MQTVSTLIRRALGSRQAEVAGRVILSLTLLSITLAIFAPARHYEFLNYDDNQYVTSNPHVLGGLTTEDCVWAFTAFYSNNWHPLTWLSHMLDVEIWGLNAGSHHLTSVIIHSVNVALLFLVLNKFTGAIWRSCFVAAIFAWHPLHVESVAWVAERKDVLSTLFWILTMGAYVHYVRRGGYRNYLLVILCFAFGLISKPMLVTLPLVLLLLDFWPLRRLGGKEAKTMGNLIWEKFPLLLMAAVSCLVTFLAQGAEAVQSLERLPLAERLANGATSYVGYITKALYPADLAVFYPFRFAIPLWQIVGASVILLLLTSLALLAAPRYPYFAVGWLWYIVTLVPVIGIVQVGDQAMADRYTYLPLVGLSVAFVWGITDLANKWRYGRPVASVVLLFVLVCCVFATAHQLRYWAGSIPLFKHAVEVTSKNWLAHNNLGTAFLNRGEAVEAIQQFEEALRFNPGYAPAHSNMAMALAEHSRIEEAIAQYREALRLNPGAASPLNNLAWLLATHPDPKYRDGTEALQLAQAACQRMEYDDPWALDTLAAAYAENGRFDEAVQIAEKACVLARTMKRSDLANEIQKRQNLYKRASPYRQSQKTE